MSKTVRACAVITVCTLGLFMVLWVFLPHNIPLFPLVFCAIGGGILCYGYVMGFHALRIHDRVGGQYGNEAFYRFFTRMYVIGCASVLVVGTADVLGTPTLTLVCTVPIGMASLFYIAVYSVYMQKVCPSVAYILNGIIA